LPVSSARPGSISSHFQLRHDAPGVRHDMSSHFIKRTNEAQMKQGMNAFLDRLH
jgi:hypothetical protein